MAQFRTCWNFSSERSEQNRKNSYPLFWCKFCCWVSKICSTLSICSNTETFGEALLPLTIKDSLRRLFSMANERFFNESVPSSLVLLVNFSNKFSISCRTVSTSLTGDFCSLRDTLLCKLAILAEIRYNSIPWKIKWKLKSINRSRQNW